MSLFCISCHDAVDLVNGVLSLKAHIAAVVVVVVMVTEAAAVT